MLKRIAADCEEAGLRISTTKFEAVVLYQRKVVFPLLVVEKFKSFGILCTRMREDQNVRSTGRLVWGVLSCIIYFLH